MKIKNFIYSGNLSLKIEDTPFMTLKGRKEKKNEGRNKEDRKEGKRRQEERKTGKKEGRKSES